MTQSAWIWAAGACGVLALSGLRVWQGLPVRLPVLYEVREFALVDQDGAPYTRESMQGRTVIANFIFTKCPSVCPRLTRTMADLQRQLKDKGLPVQLLSVSVDPERDTPGVLRKYAEAAGADLTSWAFLTGTLPAITAFVEGTFKLSMGETVGKHLRGVAHTERFALVDTEGWIRGTYEAEPGSLRTLLQHTQAVAEKRVSRL